MRARIVWVFIVFVALTAHAQRPSAARIAELMKEFPELDHPDDPQKGGYAHDPHIRREVAPREVENRYSESLRKLDDVDLDRYLSETAADNAQTNAQSREVELESAQTQLVLAAAFLRELEESSPTQDPDRESELENAKKAVDRATKVRDRAQADLVVARRELAEASANALAVRSRYNAAWSAEEQARIARERFFPPDSEEDCAALGMPFQRGTILVRFRDDASPLDIRKIRSRYGLTFRTGIPEISFFIAELSSKPNESDLEQTLRVRRTVTMLRNEFFVYSAVLQGTLGPTTVPPRSSQASLKPCWNWFEECSGMVGVKNPRFPAAWNFNDSIRRRGNVAVPVVVLDAGFVDHEDLSLTRVCTDAKDIHGNLVAGILAASWGNGKGIDGATPFVSVSACAPDLVDLDCEGDNQAIFSSVLMAVRRLFNLRPRVINISLGYNWVVRFGSSSTPVDRNDIKSFVEAQGGAFRDLLWSFRDRNVIFVSAAGNDCGFLEECDQSAEWTSPANWAALGTSTDTLSARAENVFVVESVDADGQVSRLSNRNGTLAAPGIDLLTPDDQGGYIDSEFGTSLSAPVVSGVVALMLAYNPQLSIGRIRSILKVGESASPVCIDAFDAMVQSRDDALRDLADLTGDGKVDMADFEVFRSHLKQTERGVFTCDLNGDGLIDANDRFFPRSDLNGDGALSRTATHAIAGFKDPMTDLQVMKIFWSDPKVKADDLDALLDQ